MHFLNTRSALKCLPCALLSLPQDLTDSIASGDFPEWTLAIQTMELADENSFEFDPLDATKVRRG